jgi:hypothetical protein
MHCTPSGGKEEGVLSSTDREEEKAVQTTSYKLRLLHADAALPCPALRCRRRCGAVTTGFYTDVSYTVTVTHCNLPRPSSPLPSLPS